MKPRIAYHAGDSVLHRLHPLLKLGWMIAATLLVFLFPGITVPGVLLAGLLLCFRLIRVRLRDLRGFRLLLLTSVGIMLLQVIFSRTGEPLFMLGPIPLTGQGLARGLYLGARFIVVILSSYLFVLSTSPNQLAYALMRAGLPYRFGFTLVTALRMIPIFEAEALIVYRAQLVRGVTYSGKNLRVFWRNLQSFLLPLLVSAIHKVDALSISMEGRCYGMHRTRTYFGAREGFRGDWPAGVGLVLTLSAALVIKWLEG